MHIGVGSKPRDHNIVVPDLKRCESEEQSMVCIPSAKINFNLRRTFGSVEKQFELDFKLAFSNGMLATLAATHVCK